MMMRGYNVSLRVANTLRAARAEGTRLGCAYVSPELLLLGMMADESTLAATALANLGVTREMIGAEIQTQIARLASDDVRIRGLMPYTSGAKRALEAAMSEASERDDNQLEAEHVLLGILRDPGSDTARMLAAHGVTADRAKTEIERLRSSS